MQDIARILHRAVPTPPTDFLLAEALKPLWLRCCSQALQRVEPVSYCHGRLFVVVPGSAFAARLRQEMADLLAHLRTEPGLQGISEIVVRLAEGPRPGPVRSALPLPARRYPQATRCLSSLADAIDDPDLKASLARLASTLTISGAHSSVEPLLIP